LWKARSIDRPLTSRDLQITDASYGVTLALWRCRDCQFIFADGDDLEQLTALYERLSDPEYLSGHEARALQMRWLIGKIVEAHHDARTLLDVGAGVGLLVEEAGRCGLDAVGVEPSRALVDYGRVAHQVTLLQGVLPHPGLAGRRFDVVAVVDVLEHVTDPVALLRHCLDMLNPGGVILVVTPDVGSLMASVMGSRWWHFRLAHVGYFSSASMARAAAQAGLRVSRTFRPRWYFRVNYLADRLRRYLPVEQVNRVAKRVKLLRGAYQRVVPLAPRDSLGVILRRDVEMRCDDVLE
jgi:2-polyprenyl-3-methyl-5-hydroxy-6-metoxy-1,4-benzoquinol methylase